MVELNTLIDEKDSSMLSINQTMNAFELTSTHGFQSLKIRQTEIAVRVRACSDVYSRLKDLELDLEDPKSAEYVCQIVEFNDDRHDTISMIKAFYAASGEGINANHMGDAKASLRRAKSVVKLIECWRGMLKSTKFLQQDEDDEDDNDEDNVWVRTPTIKNMADLVTVVTSKTTEETSHSMYLTSLAIAEESRGRKKAPSKAEEKEETEAGATMSTMGKVAHELRSRSVEMKEFLTPKSKSKTKARKESQKEITSPIRSSTPTPVPMTEEEREREDKAMEKGSSGKKKKANKKGKGASPRKDLAEEEKEKDSSAYETKTQAGGGVVAIRQIESNDEEPPTVGKMKMQIFEKDEETEKMLEKLKREQMKFEEAKRKSDQKEKKLRELKEKKEHEEKKKGLALLLSETRKAREEQEEAMKKVEEEIELLEEEEEEAVVTTTPVREKYDWTDQRSKSQEKRERKEKKEKEEAKERKKDREEREEKKKLEKKESDAEYIRSLEETIRKATQEKKAMKRKGSLESAEELLILGEEEEEEEEDEEERKKEKAKEGRKKPQKKTLEEVHLESMANKRLIAARPTRDDERWGDDQTMTYNSFRTNFKAASGSEGVNPRDILQEVIHWVRGVPKALVKNFMTAKKPEKGVKEMWEELDALYNLHILTAEERVKGILKKQKVAKENSSSHILLMAELKTLWREAEEDDMERQLDRPEIIRDIVMGRIPYIADDFYSKEGKKRVKDPIFRMKFKDMLDMITAG